MNLHKIRDCMRKRYVSVLLLVCMLLTQTGNIKVFASNEEVLEMQYVMEVLGGYLAINDNLEYNGLTISTQRHIYNIDGSESGKNYYLLFSSNAVIGMIIVEKANNSYSSYFTTEATDILSDLYTEGKPFVLSSIRGNLVLVTKQDYEILVSEFLGTPLTSVNTSNLLNKLATISVVDVSNNPAMASVNSTYSVTGTPPPLVANGRDPINGGGLCWAASIASVINYRRGNNTETANSIFMDCWYTVACSKERVPCGTTEWMLTAFSVNSINDITYIEDSLAIGEISTMLGTYSKPIITVIYGERDTRETIAHAVVMYEFAIIGSNGYYKIMDPNCSSYVTVSINYDSLNNTSYFPYSPLWVDGKYTRWESSYY